MKIVEFTKLKQVGRCLITLGNFDGFHRGQVAVLERLVKRSRQHGMASLVFSFKPHPQLNQPYFSGLIQSQTSKDLLFAELKVDYVCYLEFEQIKGLEYYQFLDLIKEKTQLSGLVASEKLQFGFLKKGVFLKVKEYFDNFLEDEGAVTELVPCVHEDSGMELSMENHENKNEKLSSSMIRSWLMGKDNQFFKINRALMLPFHLAGVVIKGRQLGRQIGFPTINFKYPLSTTLKYAVEENPPQVKVPNGSYVTLTYLAGEVYRSVSYVGNPNQSEVVLVETHLFDFSTEVYDQVAMVFFLDFLGPPEPTQDIEDVKAVIAKQKAKGLAYFKAQNDLSIVIEKIKKVFRRNFLKKGD